MTLRKRLTKYFRDFTYVGAPRKVTDSDMCDVNALMDMKEAIWTTLDEEDLTAREHKWLTDLYGDLDDYIADECYRDYAKAIDKDRKLALCAGLLGLLIVGICPPDWLTVYGLLISGLLVYMGIRR